MVLSNKRGISLSIETVVIIAVVLFVLVIVAGFFFGGFGRSATGISGISSGGEEAASELDTKAKIEEAQGGNVPGSPGGSQTLTLICCETTTTNPTFSYKETCGITESRTSPSNCKEAQICQNACTGKGYTTGTVNGYDDPNGYCECT